MEGEGYLFIQYSILTDYSPCYSPAAPPEGGAVHHRWNHRSQSVPNVVFPGLDTNGILTNHSSLTTST